MASRQVLKLWLGLVVTIAACVSSDPASAQIVPSDLPPLSQPGPPYLTPENPTSSDIIKINAYRGWCDLLSGWDPTVVTRNGDEITVILTGVHYEDSELCFFPPGVESEQIGNFPPGNYSVNVIWQYPWLNGYAQVSLGILPLTIVMPSAASTASVPALDEFGFVSLIVILAGLSFVRLKIRP